MSYNDSLTPYSKKEIFELKLKDEPFDVLEDNYFNDLDWLIKYKIIEYTPCLSGLKRNDTFMCNHTIRFWNYNRDKLAVASWLLTPGERYTWPR